MDETSYLTGGELEVIVGDETFVLKVGYTLMAPRAIPHELRNPGGHPGKINCSLAFLTSILGANRPL